MRITKEHAAQIHTYLAEGLKSLDIHAAYTPYEDGTIECGDKVMRFCFDCLYYCTRRNKDMNDFILDVIYKYANDDNIYAVLKAYMRKVNHRCMP